MGKIKLKMSIISDFDNLEIETTGIISKNKIIYKENDVVVTILMDDNKIEMNRSTKDYSIELIFIKISKSISRYKLFNKYINLETFTNKLVKSSNKIKLDYTLEGNRFSYVLDWRIYDNR